MRGEPEEDLAEAQPDVATSERTSLFVAGGWSIAGWLLSFLIGLPLTVVLVRTLPARSYGTYATATSLLAILLVAGSFGLSSSVARFAAVGANDEERSAQRVHAIRRSIFIATVLSVSLCSAICLVLALVHGDRVFLLPFAAAAPVVLCSPLSQASLGIARSLGRFRLVTLSGLATAAFIVISSLALVSAGYRGTVLLVLARSLGVLVGFAVLIAPSGLLGIRGEVRTQESDSRLVRGIILLGGAVLVSWMFTVLISQVDVLYLGLVKGRLVASTYAPVSKLADGAQALFFLVAGYVLPAFTRSVAARDFHSFGELYRWASRWGLTVSLPAIVLMEAIPKDVLQVLYGEATPRMVVISRILGAGVVVSVLLGYNGLTLVAMEERRALVTIGAIGIGLTFATCIFLVPIFSGIGAAVGTTAPLMFFNVAATAVLWRRIGLRPIDWRICTLLAIVLVSAGIAVVVCREAGFNDWQTVIGVGLATGMAGLGGSVAVGGHDDRALLRTVASRRSGAAVESPPPV